TADQLANLVLAAEAREALLVKGGETVIVPADGPADLDVVGVDTAGGVVRGGDAGRGPVSQPAPVAQLGGESARAGAGLTFQLHEVQLGDAVLVPQVGRQAHLGEDAAVEADGETFDGAGAEVVAGDDAVRRHALKRLGHGGISQGVGRTLLYRAADGGSTAPRGAGRFPFGVLL